MKIYAVTMILKCADKCNERKPDCDAIKRMIREQIKEGRYEKEIFRGRVDLDIKEIETTIIQV